MQFTIATVLSLLTVALAAPAAVVERQVPYTACTGLYGTAQCCATDILGLADLDCANPPATLTSAVQFQATCSDIGQRARCCLLPILGQALVCETPAGLPTA
ncbi:hypothetical protein SMACR_08025 [Sordaria macrospora]|uniref:WGS project CABT00000000 data, contig 2.13 n=2 Tax=Sordaria macrospora TaxID=5147 RepID=F7VY75_SORMK|nr:uncharacterized protein SMAC_08025 [Sordaria macrospora k-hell]KAA8632596.1 hypothetical protein SMACR_08025 [Sordaria macrospora]KAH7631592.1 Cerato-ulmin hydrophobin family [Sordaria sp. MPI-SDFR-AT-0083]WPJ62911.1 hypothetical protein SMAC4_08025 [Sordaria macrospora]CCC10469.1 unnamed protein product [Sordaria macrospora k-hell]